VLVRWMPGCSPVGVPEELLVAETVAQLCGVVMRARSDPRVEGYRYWRLREWDDGSTVVTSALPALHARCRLGSGRLPRDID
jgi:hypothetical protein